MDKIIKNVLKKIENNGYEAYIVGGYVRDALLGNISHDIDICTNALPKDLYSIFNETHSSNSYGGFNIKIKKYNIDITTYRKELKYVDRKPVEVEYIDNLLEDVKRRDFTINAICMNYNTKIIDLVNGIEDINNHLIRMIGDPDEKLVEDPLRILRAIRFATVLNFELEETLYNSIKKNYKLVNTLSNTRIKSELNRILLSTNYMKGLSLLKDFKILDLLNISYNDINYINDINGMWAQLNGNHEFAFTKQEKENIIKIRDVLSIGYLNNEILYKYGPYISQIAGNILNIPKNVINDMFNKLPLTNKSELEISSKELLELLNIDNKSISKIIEHLINKMINGNLKNNKKEIKKYLLIHKEELENEKL